MDIIFKTKQLQKLANVRRLAQRKLGVESGDLFIRRLEEMRSCDNLVVLVRLPQARCHLLKGGKLRGKFAVDLAHPYRLLFEPAENPIPRLDDGSLDLHRIKSVRILEVKDYHD